MSHPSTKYSSHIDIPVTPPPRPPKKYILGKEVHANNNHTWLDCK